MNDDIENVINDMTDDLTLPNVGNIHTIAAQRKQKRQTATKIGGITAAVLLIAGLGFWFARPEPTQLATGNETDSASGAVADDSAPILLDELEEWPGDTGFRDFFLAMPRGWTPVDRIGVPETDYFQEQVYFYSSPNGDGIGFASCVVATPFIIEWTTSGFAVIGRDVQAALELIACENVGQEGVAATPIQSGETVAVTQNNDGTYTLEGHLWSLRIAQASSATTQPSVEPVTTATTTTTTEVPPNPPSPESYISLTVEEAGNLATSNGIEWRVVREDGEDFDVTADFTPGRLNFSVINGLVSSVDVESEAPIATTPLGNWAVESVIVDGVEIVHPTGFQALIIDGNSASGHDGCNSWGGKTVQWDESGTFALTGNSTSTSQLCPTGTESTAAYNQALRQTTTWEIATDGALILSGPGGRIVLS